MVACHFSRTPVLVRSCFRWGTPGRRLGAAFCRGDTGADLIGRAAVDAGGPTRDRGGPRGRMDSLIVDSVGVAPTTLPPYITG